MKEVYIFVCNVGQVMGYYQYMIACVGDFNTKGKGLHPHHNYVGAGVTYITYIMIYESQCLEHLHSPNDPTKCLI